MNDHGFEKLFGEPVDMGRWFPYNAYVNQEQLSIQRNHLFSTDLYNVNGVNDIKFVPTKLIKMYNDDIMAIQNRVKIVDAKSVLENEAFYSAKIEGAETTLARTQELNNGSKVRQDAQKSEQMVLGCLKAANHLSLAGDKLSKDILVDVWKILIEGCCENKGICGEGYRIGDVYVGGHTGMDYKKIDGYMEQFMDFYNGSKYDEFPFMKAILLHYMFETIHPFCDGNGRLGRLLIYKYLATRGINSCRAVSFSKFIEERRSSYDVAFIDSENIYNDCTPFMEYMLGIFADALHAALEMQIEKEK